MLILLVIVLCSFGLVVVNSSMVFARLRVLVVTDEVGIGAKIYLDGSRIQGIDPRGENLSPSLDTIPDTKMVLIEVPDKRLHRISLKKTQDRVEITEERRFKASDSLLQLDIPMGNTTINDGRIYSIKFEIDFSAEFKVNGISTAFIDPNEHFEYKFKNGTVNEIEVIDRESGNVYNRRITQSDKNSIIKFSNKIYPDPLFVITILILVAGLAYLVYQIYNQLKKSGDKEQEYSPQLNPPNPKSGWPDYMRYQYPHLNPIKQLAIGGMSTIWVVKNMNPYNPQTFQKETVVKLLHEQYCRKDSQEAKRFMDESVVLLMLKDTGIIPKVFARSTEAPVNGARLWVEMEYLKKWLTLRQILKRRNRGMDWLDAKDLISKIVYGVNSIHKMGVIHRDLSPENILISPTKKNRSIKIIDFGIAKVKNRENKPIEFDVDYTTPGEVLGKVRYAPPEQWSIGGLQKLDESGDFYPVGIMIYELLVGRQPFLEKAEHIGLNSIKELTEKGMPEDKAFVVKKMLDPTPVKRISSDSIIKTFR
jgi:serine/threonine protein kinase